MCARVHPGRSLHVCPGIRGLLRPTAAGTPLPRSSPSCKATSGRGHGRGAATKRSLPSLAAPAPGHRTGGLCAGRWPTRGRFLPPRRAALGGVFRAVRQPAPSFPFPTPVPKTGPWGSGFRRDSRATDAGSRTAWWQLQGSLPSVVCLKPPSPPTTWVPVDRSQTLPVSVSDQGAPLWNKRGSAQVAPAPLPQPGTVPDPDFL